VRLALAQREAFAPLNGLFEPTPPPPILPDPDTAAALREEAREQLDVAQAHRRMRLPPARRGARGARRRHRRRPPLRRPAVPRLRRVVAILDVVDAAKVVGAGVTSQIARSGSRRVSDSAVARWSQASSEPGRAPAQLFAEGAFGATLHNLRREWRGNKIFYLDSP
jgi:hypothetical protein